MRRIAYILMMSLALLGYSLPADAHGFRGGGAVAMHGGGFRGDGFRGHGFHGGGHFAGHHHHHFRSSVIVGVGPVFFDPWWGYSYPYRSETVVVQQPQEYIYEDPTPSGTWYFCKDSGQYYPYVKQCPGGWTSVAPQTAP